MKPALFLALVLVACAAPDAKPAASAEAAASPGAPSAAPTPSAAPIGSAPNPTTKPHQWLEAKHLVGSWQHVQEKDVDGLQTFVGAREKLPPARFRAAYELTADGKARVLCLAPDDAHEIRDGKWQIDQDVLTIEVQCFGPKPDVVKYSVERATGRELAMRPLP